MIDFKKYFEDSYQFALKEIRYDLVEATPGEGDLIVKVSDSIGVEKGEQIFDVTFCREVGFEPEALYRLRVTFGIKLTLKEGVEALADGVDWDKALALNDNPYIQNVGSRISKLIADITSSYGFSPIVTPPNFIKSENG